MKYQLRALKIEMVGLLNKNIQSSLRKIKHYKEKKKEE